MLEEAAATIEALAVPTLLTYVTILNRMTIIRSRGKLILFNKNFI